MYYLSKSSLGRLLCYPNERLPGRLPSEQPKSYIGVYLRMGMHLSFEQPKKLPERLQGVGAYLENYNNFPFLWHLHPFGMNAASVHSMCHGFSAVVCMELCNRRSRI